MTPWLVRCLGGALGSAFYSCSKRYRTVAIKNLRAAYPGATDDWVRRTAREVFRHFAREGLQFFRLLSLGKQEIDAMIDIEGVEHIDRALSSGKGCVAITAHYGNWELLARKLAIQGYPINVIARDSDDPGLTGMGTRMRESGGYKVFDKDQPIIGAFRRLKRNEILGILPDQNESHGILVPFFGLLARTAPGPAVLALKSGAPMLSAFAHRKDDGRYLARVYPVIDFQPTGDDEADIASLTALFTKAIETEVRTNPAQWLWLHDRWKSSPEAPQ